MILDDNLVFFDGLSLSGLDGGDAASDPVALNSLFRPGTNHDHIPMLITVVEGAEGGDSLEITLQQADSADGEYGDAPGAGLTVAAADLARGARIGWSRLPAGVTKPWIRLRVASSGGFSAGKIFAALTREDARPYSEGMYKNAGRTLA